MGLVSLSADQRTRTRFAVVTSSPGASASGGGEPSTPTFEGIGSHTLWNNEGASKTVTAPAHDTGDLLVLGLYDGVISTADAPPVPAGWTQQHTYTDSGNGQWYIWTRVADGTATDSPSLNPSGSSFYGIGVTLAFSGATGTEFTFVDTVSTADPAVGASAAAPSDATVGLSFAGRPQTGGWSSITGADTVHANINETISVGVAEVGGNDGDDVGSVSFSWGGAVERLIVTMTIGLPAPVSLSGTILDLSPEMFVAMDMASGAPTEQGSISRTWTVTTAPTYQAHAGPDGADYANFATNDKISTVAADLGIDASVGDTFLFTYRPNAFGTSDAPFGKLGSGSGRDYLFYGNPDAGKFHFLWYADNSSALYSRYAHPDAATAGEWNTFLIRANTDGTMTLWQNAAAAVAAVEVAAPSGTPEENGPAEFFIGLSPFAGLDADGAIGFVAKFGTALSDTDCEALMQAAIDEGWTP